MKYAISFTCAVVAVCCGATAVFAAVALPIGPTMVAAGVGGAVGLVLFLDAAERVMRWR